MTDRPATDADATAAGARVAEHYRVLLAGHYTWMLGGDIEVTAAEHRALFDRLLPDPADRVGPAIDLGCGSGAQTLALADRGHDPVDAVDTDATLLAELAGHTGERPAVRLREADAVTALHDAAPATLTTAVCMGDTLLHLADPSQVEALLAAAARALRPGGALVLGYRSLIDELAGTDRFLPVRSDPDRILMCFLETTGPDTVEVHDILHTRDHDRWRTTVSSYPKLRLHPDWLTERLTDAGFDLEHHDRGPSGMWLTLGRRR